MLRAALAFGAGFAARLSTRHSAHAAHIMKRALQHPGLAVIELSSPAGRAFRLEEAGHDPSNREAALARLADPEAFGLFYIEERERAPSTSPLRSPLALSIRPSSLLGPP